MPRRQVAGVFILSALAAAACGSGGEDRPPGPPVGSSGSGGAGGGSGGGGEDTAGAGGTDRAGAGGDAAGSGGDTAGSGGSSGAPVGGAGGTTGGTGGGSGGISDPDGGLAGSGAGGFPGSICGDSFVTGFEHCDGDNFGTFTCVDFGFEVGTLACLDTCAADTAGCSGTERCADGRDNDGDGSQDCLDLDCEAECADPCTVADPIVLPADYFSTTFGHSSSLDASCGSDTGAPDVVYPIVADVSGVLEAILVTDRSLNVSVHGACGDAGTEITCAEVFAKVPVVAGESYFVVVDGNQADDLGPFDLQIVNRAVDCGDGFTDGAEECDDGDEVGSDGCSSTCTLESSEDSDNDSFGTADTYVAPYAGTITLGDQDYVRVVVPEDNSGILARMLDFDARACELGLQDSYLEILDTNGTTVLEANDDTDEGFCAEAIASASYGEGNLDAGTYYVRVAAPPVVQEATFTYLLEIIVNHCGDQVRGPTERCDDGNATAGDLCAPDCTLEPLP